MPHSTYVPEHMGSATMTPAGPLVAGRHASLTLVYTAGTFGIDDSGHLKITWRGTSDMAKPQFTDPAGPGYTTIEADNGAVLETRVERINIRPWVNTLFIRVGRGFLRKGETITVRFGDTRQGSPGLRMQTNVEPTFEFKIFVDAFATYDFVELPRSPEIALVAGPPARWKAILPTLTPIGERFRLAIVPEDLWGNPTGEVEAILTFASSQPIAGLPPEVRLERGAAPLVLDGLTATTPGTLDVSVKDEGGRELCRSNPMRLEAEPALRRFWGDLHAQSEETIGTNSAEDYFAFARDRAFVDIAGHQGNDFQITDAFWRRLNEITAAFDEPGRFVAVPGYEWSGNTGMGGDRNVFYRSEGRPIRRSSRVLVTDPSDADCYTAGDLFAALSAADEDAVVIAHVGGRYADLSVAHDGRFERAVEIHSTWGTFEWLLHDALERGFRPGIVCHSDDHKGRPGAAQPGASTFGAIGGLTCYLMPELTRDALFEALRRRRHYGTTGNRMILSVNGRFAEPVTIFDDDPALGPAATRLGRDVLMGDIVRAGGVPMQLSVDAAGSAPIDRIDLFYGTVLVRSERPAAAAPEGRRVRIMWSGAEYRGRGREVAWRGSLRLDGNRFMRFAAVNFLNPELEPKEIEAEIAIAWRSVTTGNMAGLDLWLEDGRSGAIEIETNVVSAQINLASLGSDDMVFDGGGLERRLRVFRLPDGGGPRTLSFEHDVVAPAVGDRAVYARVTQEDGHQAWSSPVYLIA